ncbi:MAG TPA: NAD(P)-binding domain-containing protein [Bacteroidales bacterium]|jgi:glycerol-3-phosphate dehydrogenase (NAD(P)+)|nr:NAD(P)-binding domain-containing protein [Bacteroidales bacterium]HQQ02608.1 NAD(P)-binding domain-containing protein [Bacteroidales bacterium]
MNTEFTSRFKKIVIIGSGSIGTAMAQALASNSKIDTTILSIESDVIDEINHLHRNSKYFPGFLLASEVKAVSDKSVLNEADLVFLALPSVAVIPYIRENASLLSPQVVLVNMAKGFDREGQTISEGLLKEFPFGVVAMKGPSFAKEMINGSPTAFTIGCKDNKIWPLFEEVFANTQVYLDFSKDIKGVELLSILKNIYAIAVGMMDAQFNTANMRFLFLTRAFNEMRSIHILFGGKKSTMFKYCGFGDFGLTALNDLSRNRTLGLLIGKGYFTEQISEKVLLEGRLAVNIFCGQIIHSRHLDTFPIMSGLYHIFSGQTDVSEFVEQMLQK